MKIKTFIMPIIILYIVFINFSIVFAGPPEISAEGAVLIDAKTGVVLYDKNMNEKYYPASITKIMTVLLAIENCEDDERVYMSDNAIFGIERNSSHIAMDVGETLSMNDALYGIMLESANEVSMAVGEHISGDIKTFAALMTKRAAELGAYNTNFINPHGLHDPEHYTTPYDIAQIMRKAITYEKFIKLISTRGYRIPPTERQPLERPLNNHHKMIQPGMYFYEYVIGGKTGYTDQSRNTLVTYAVKDDIELIVAVMKSPPNVTYTDTKALFEYGFEMYHLAYIFDKDSYSGTVTVGDSYGEASVVPLKSLTIKVPNYINDKNVTTQVELPDMLPETISAGEVAGTIKILFDGKEIAKTDLIVDKIIIKEKETTPEANIVETFAAEQLTDMTEKNENSEDNERVANKNVIKPWQIGIILFALALTTGAGVYARKEKIIEKYFKRG